MIENLKNYFKPENYLIIIIASMFITGVFAYITAMLFSKEKHKKKDIDKNIKEVFQVKRNKKKKNK